MQLTLGEQVWEAEGTSIKKAQHSTAAKALDESVLPRPAPRSPKVDINSNPGNATPTSTRGKKNWQCIYERKGTLEVWGLISLSENGKHLHANLLVTEISTDSVAAAFGFYFLEGDGIFASKGKQRPALKAFIGGKFFSLKPLPAGSTFIKKC